MIARHQWLFVNHTTAVALAYFAHGQAMYYAHHYEAAMGSYDRVERWLARSEIAPQGEGNRRFVATLREWLDVAAELARRVLWPEVANEAPGGIPVGDTPPATTNVTATTTPAVADPSGPQAVSPDATPQPATDIPTPLPILPTAVARPHSNLPLASQREYPTPAPGHRLVDERYRWCQIVGQRQTQGSERNEGRSGEEGPVLASTAVGTWLLIDRNVARHHFQPGQMVVLGSDQENWGETLVWPGETEFSFQYYYLGRVVAGGVLLAESDRLAVRLEQKGRPHAITQRQLVGLFVGAWSTALA